MRKQHPYYRQLLRLYPAAYRQQYGAQMVQTLSDMLADVDTTPKRLVVWSRIIADLPVSLIKAQAQYAGAAYRSEMPDSVKRSGLLATILLLPFFLALAANGLDKIMYGHNLYHSWLWRLPYLGIWVLWLPSIALAFMLISFGQYVWRPSRPGVSMRLRRVFDMAHIWPIIVPGILAFGILFMLVFHDSAHCWEQNPAYFVTRFHKTLTCTENGFLGG